MHGQNHAILVVRRPNGVPVNDNAYDISQVEADNVPV